jgi:hypothetical protein
MHPLKQLRGEIMKEKEIKNAEGIENLESELFGSFDPEDELWIVGGSKTITDMYTFTPTGPDTVLDIEYTF